MKKLLLLTFGILVLGVLTLAGLFRYYFGPGGDGIVGEITVDNRRYAVTQEWNGYAGGEPYDVDFVYELEDGTWGWCYISHEDIRWSSAQLVHDPLKDTIDIHQSGTLRARLDRRASTFELFGSMKRVCDAPQNSGAAPLP